MRVWIENRKYHLHLRMISWYNVTRKIIGRFNSLFINTNKDHGKIKLHKWQLKLFKCVTPSDFYIITGIYDALIKTKICEGYRNFGFSYNTYKEILYILRYNYKWNEETMWGDTNKIQFTWALGSTPMSIKGVKDWVVLWDKDEVRGEIDGTID